MTQTRSPELVAEYDAAILERLALDPDEHPDGPLIDLRDVALLGGLSPTTPGMARQRTAKGIAKVPFPKADPEEGSRWADKPLFRAYLILDYFQQSGNWPLGSAARPAQRHRRPGPKTPSAPDVEKITWTQLREKDEELAEGIRAAKLNDGSRRSPEQWRHRYENRRATPRPTPAAAPTKRRKKAA